MCGIGRVETYAAAGRHDGARARTGTSGIDVRDHGCPGRCPITLPGFETKGRRVGREVESTVAVDQVDRAAPSAPRIDILDELRTAGRTVALPQLLAGDPIIGREEES